MKKIFAIHTFTFAFTFTFAQSYQVQDGVDISNGTRTYWCDSSNATITHYYWLKNISSTAVTGKVYKRIYQLNDASATCWWCVGTQCYPPTFVVSSSFTLNAGVGTMLTIDFDPAGHLGTTVVRYVAINNSNSADSTYIDITYIMPGGPASVNVHAANETELNVFPNPSNGIVNVNYELDANNFSGGVFSLYNSLGEVVSSIPFYDPKGILHVDAAELPAGTYIGIIFSGDVAVSRKRIVIAK